MSFFVLVRIYKSNGYIYIERERLRQRQRERERERGRERERERCEERGVNRGADCQIRKVPY